MSRATLLSTVFATAISLPTLALADCYDYSCHETSCPYCCDASGPAVGGSLEFLWWSTNYNFPVALLGDIVPGDDIVISQFVTETPVALNFSIGRTDQTWSPGGRAGLFFSPCAPDGIDIRLFWTYYQNKSTASHSSPETTIFAGLLDFAKARLMLTYNAADVEFGKYLYPCADIIIRPFAGVRFIWLDQDHLIKLNGTTTDMVGPDNAQESVMTALPQLVSLSQEVRAVGPRIGLNIDWFDWCGFRIISSGSSALAYGKTKQKLKFDITSTGTDHDDGETDLTVTKINGKVDDDYWQLFPTLQLSLGLSWEYCFCTGRTLSAFAAWEGNFLWETQSIIYIDRAISMQGLTIGLKTEF